MASSSGQPIRLAIQIILAIAIIGLAYWLYLSITEPYKVIERGQQLTRITRDRMSDIRSAMIRYNEQNGRYLTTLDSLVEFIRQDSVLRVASDSVFGEGFTLDSLIYSPRTGEPFRLTVNDTSRVKTYLLEDPGSDDYIGSIEPDITRVNAASWE